MVAIAQLMSAFGKIMITLDFARLPAASCGRLGRIGGTLLGLGVTIVRYCTALRRYCTTHTVFLNYTPVLHKKMLRRTICIITEFQPCQACWSASLDRRIFPTNINSNLKPLRRVGRSGESFRQISTRISPPPQACWSVCRGRRIFPFKYRIFPLKYLPRRVGRSAVAGDV